MQQHGGETEMTDLYFSKVNNDEHEAEDDLEMEMEAEMRSENGHTMSLPTNTRRHFKAISMTILLVVAALALMFRTHSTIQESGTSNVSSEQWSPNWAPELNEKNWKLDTKRQLEVFTSKLKSGSKYFIKQDTSMTSSSSASFTTVHEAESEMMVSGTPQGVQEIDITFTRTQMKIDMMGNSFDFDSNREEDVEDVFKSLKELFGDNVNVEDIIKPMMELVGHSIKITLQENNDISEASGHEDLFKELKKRGSENLITSESYQQMNWAVEALPDKPVKPGDEWHTSIDIDGILMNVQVKLLGYTDYNGHDVAIFSMEGDYDVEKLMDKAVKGLDSSVINALDKIEFTNATMTSFIYWDHKDKFARFNKGDVIMTMNMQKLLNSTSSMNLQSVRSTRIWIDADI